MGAFHIVFFCLAVALVGARSPPVMPSQFSASFTNPSGSNVSTGAWYYDYDLQVQRVDGGNQMSCSSVTGKKGEYCTTFLSAKTGMLLFFPFSDFCCVDNAPGIGILRPDWLAYDNAVYQGEEIVNGRTCDVWLAMGSSKNYWLQDGDFPCLLDDGGFNWTFTSFQPGPFPIDLVTIPPACYNANKCP